MGSAAADPSPLSLLDRGQRIKAGGAILASVAAGVLHYAGANDVVVFIVAAAALALLATVVGLGTEALSERMSAGATGIMQSALGNLPELFVSIFALRAGLVTVVQASIVGSILGNSLLVLGLAFFLGGWKHGVQKFGAEAPRMISTLLMLAVAALIIPTLVHEFHTPGEPHAEALSVACAVVLLLVFVGSLVVSLRNGGDSPDPPVEHHGGTPWPTSLAIGLLLIGGVGAALVSEWFVAALEPATKTLGISEAFTGLVVVAIAGHAVENVVGVQLAMKNKSDYAVSVILNSSLQIALAVAPILVLLSFVVGAPHHLTLVLPPLMVVALFLAAIISVLVVVDGESTWLEGAILIGLYGIIAASFWWG
ncbi:MAG: calcium/proton exchanger [Thermomicrobiales bacterium]